MSAGICADIPRAASPLAGAAGARELSVLGCARCKRFHATARTGAKAGTVPVSPSDVRAGCWPSERVRVCVWKCCTPGGCGVPPAQPTLCSCIDLGSSPLVFPLHNVPAAVCSSPGDF